MALLALLLVGSLVRAQDTGVEIPQNPEEGEAPPQQNPEEQPPPEHTDEPPAEHTDEPPQEHTDEPPTEIPGEGTPSEGDGSGEHPAEGEGEHTEEPPPGPPVCSCSGLDYTNGGSYLIDASSTNDFVFTSEFSGMLELWFRAQKYHVS